MLRYVIALLLTLHLGFFSVCPMLGSSMTMAETEHMHPAEGTRETIAHGAASLACCNANEAHKGTSSTVPHQVSRTGISIPQAAVTIPADAHATPRLAFNATRARQYGQDFEQRSKSKRE